VRAYHFAEFGIDHLKLETEPPPSPGPGEVIVEVKAISLNFRDLMVVKGVYNPKLALPARPISDGAGVVAAVGEGVTGVRVGDRVVSHFISGWIDGPFRAEYGPTTLGTPRPGLACEQVALPAQAVLSIPAKYDFAQASTLPIAALTAWSALVTEGNVQARQTVLTLGTGGVSLFAVQLAKARGARVIVTSSSEEKLARVRALGADHTINYRAREDWDTAVLEATGGFGADLTVETGGAGTLPRSLKATRAGGKVCFLGALTGLKTELNLATLMMKRLHLAGMFVDSRAAFEAMNRFLEEHAIEPVIDRRFAFEQLPEALRCMERGEHFGKIVLTR